MNITIKGKVDAMQIETVDDQVPKLLEHDQPAPETTSIGTISEPARRIALLELLRKQGTDDDAVADRK